MQNFNHTMLKKSLTLVSLLSILNVNVQAQDFTDNLSGIWGLGTSVLESNYKASDTELSVAPYIFGSIGDLQIEANRVLYPLYSTSFYSVLATANYRSQQYSEELNLDRSIELGLTLEVPLSMGLTSRFTALTDVSDTHNGYELEAQVYNHYNVRKLSLLTAIAVQYQDDKLANYYYATNNYTPDSGYVFEGEVIATYPIYDFSIFAGARSYWYGNNVSNSPLASSSNTVLGFFGIGYKF